MFDLLRSRDVRLLFAGEGVSLIGDQFAFIAVPWLALELSGSAAVLGVVLALQGVPRAAFMLVGGALTDRSTPRRVMLASNLARLVLVTLLAAFVLSGRVRLGMLYGVALAFGAADGFFFPAQGAIVPQLARREQLTAANAVVQGLDQVSQFVGPVLAGGLIAAFALGRGGLEGVGLALAVDAATFVVSVVLLALMRVDRGAASRGAADGGLWPSIRAGLTYMWRDPLLRVLLLLILAVNFFAVGPLLVGVPALARLRLDDGAQGFGAIMSAFGGGSLAGLAVAGAARRPPARLLGHVLLGVCALFGVGLVGLGLAYSLLGAIVPAAGMGFAAGYLTVSFFTWIQARTPQRLMGRMMSLIIFASVGLVPLSQALSGVVASWSLTGLFVGSAAALSVIILRAWFVPSLRAMGLELGAASGAAVAAASVMPQGDQRDPGEHEGGAQPLRRRERLVEDEIRGEHLRRDEGQAHADDVGAGDRPVAHDPGEAELHAEAEEAPHDLPEDEHAPAVRMTGRREAGRGADVERLVEDDDEQQEPGLEAKEGRQRRPESVGDGHVAGGHRGPFGYAAPPGGRPTAARQAATLRSLPLRVPGDPWLYAVARVLLTPAVRLYGRFRVAGLANLPRCGPAIVVADHPSDVDPILLGVALPRPLHFLADEVQFERAFVGRVIPRLGAVAIHKGSPDRAALERALALLRRGEVVVLFGEGDLFRQAQVAPFGRGVAFLAARSGAPVVPVAIVGAERLWDGRRLRRPSIELRLGAAVRFAAPRPAAYADMAEELRRAVELLHEAA